MSESWDYGARHAGWRRLASMPRPPWQFADPPGKMASGHGRLARCAMLAARGLRVTLRSSMPRLAALALLAAAWPHAGRADGALAIGLPGDVARQGVAMGWVINYPTRAEAQSQALRHCRDFKDAPEQTRDLCKVVDAFRDECLAIALDPEFGTPGVGWAVAGNSTNAERAAMEKCMATAGRERQGSCRVTIARCDGAR